MSTVALDICLTVTLYQNQSLNADAPRPASDVYTYLMELDPRTLILNEGQRLGEGSFGVVRVSLSLLSSSLLSLLLSLCALSTILGVDCSLSLSHMVLGLPGNV